MSKDKRPTLTLIDGVHFCHCGYSGWSNTNRCLECGSMAEPSLFDVEVYAEPLTQPVYLQDIDSPHDERYARRMQEIAIMVAERRVDEASAWVNRAQNEVLDALNALNAATETLRRLEENSR